MRNIVNVCMVFQFMKRWNIRTKHTLWEEFMKVRYCERSIPNCKKGDTGDSIAWKHMLQIRDIMEQHIQLKLNAGSCSFWLHNLLCTGHLAQFSSNNKRFNSSVVANFWCNGMWNSNKLISQAPSCKLASILSIQLPTQIQLQDQAI